MIALRVAVIFAPLAIGVSASLLQFAAVLRDNAWDSLRKPNNVRFLR